MLKTSTDLVRYALHGPTMGTRWTALFHADPGFDVAGVQIALQAAVDEVDSQMSTWNPASDLMRLNGAPVGDWLVVPARLMEVLRLGLQVGAESGGAFDIGMGDAVTAWGFGPEAAAATAIQAARAAARLPAHQMVELTEGHLRKRGPITLDLNGIAKGYGTDRLAETLQDHGITAALLGIDGEMRALGLRPDASPWTIAVEAPDHDRRTPHSVLTLQDAGIATSGDYRHFVTVQGRSLSHTMAPGTGAPLLASPASVSVVARTCAQADAWATALMVLGAEAGAALAHRMGIDALFLLRGPDGVSQSLGVGRIFATTQP